MMIKGITEIKPFAAGFLGMASAGGNLAVWMDLIKGWAAFATVIIGAPTALLILCYWAIKVGKAWKFRNQKDSE